MSVAGKLFVPFVFLGFAGLFTYNVWDMSYRETAFPYVSIVAILFLTIVVVVRELTGSGRGADPDADAAAAFGDVRGLASIYALPSVTVLLMCLYVYATPHVGFYISTFVFLLVTSALTGVTLKKLPMLAVIMMGVTVASYFFFTKALQIYLP